MAIITLARQVAALGDEVGETLAQKMNYKFIKRTLMSYFAGLPPQETRFNSRFHPPLPSEIVPMFLTIS